MRFLREFSGLGSRPYPLDRERRRRVMVALSEKEMSISGLAKSLSLPISLISMVISGRRLSEKTELRIAEYLGKSAEYLFPARTPGEIGKMRREEAAAKAAAKPGRTAA